MKQYTDVIRVIPNGYWKLLHTWAEKNQVWITKSIILACPFIYIEEGRKALH